MSSGAAQRRETPGVRCSAARRGGARRTRPSGTLLRALEPSRRWTVMSRFKPPVIGSIEKADLLVVRSHGGRAGRFTEGSPAAVPWQPVRRVRRPQAAGALVLAHRLVRQLGLVATPHEQPPGAVALPVVGGRAEPLLEQSSGGLELVTRGRAPPSAASISSGATPRRRRSRSIRLGAPPLQLALVLGEPPRVTRVVQHAGPRAPRSPRRSHPARPACRSRSARISATVRSRADARWASSSARRSRSGAELPCRRGAASGGLLLRRLLGGHLGGRSRRLGLRPAADRSVSAPPAAMPSAS